MKKKNHRKRMLAVTPTYFPMMGGAERTVDELYRRIGGMGYDVDLITPDLGGKKVEKDKGFTTYRVGKKTDNRILKFILYQWYEYKLLRKLLKRKKYDLINVSYGFPNVFVTAWLKWKTKLPLVITEFHLGTGMEIVDEKQNPWYVKHFLKWIYNKAEKITVISNEQKRFVENIAGRDDVVVIFQGTDEKYFDPEKYDKEIKKKYNIEGEMLVTVSRLSTRKNIGDQIKAMELVVKKFPKAKLLIAGKGGEKEKLEKQVKNLKLEKHVSFLGFVSEEELPKIYATANLFLLTSKLEGFGIANCEALASGTPVITYDTKAAGDYILPGKTGFITKHDPKEFAGRIIQVLGDEKLLKKMSEDARKMIEKTYTWDVYTKKHKKVFEEALKCTQ